jgi:hypothetical protein
MHPAPMRTRPPLPAVPKLSRKQEAVRHYQVAVIPLIKRELVFAAIGFLPSALFGRSYFREPKRRSS